MRVRCARGEAWSEDGRSAGSTDRLGTPECRRRKKHTADRGETRREAKIARARQLVGNKTRSGGV